MFYYHGTSTNCKIEDVKKHLDSVFLTVSLRSAETYAKKACVRFGGSPIVYKASPIGIFVLNGTECICEKAKNQGVVIKL